MYYLPIGHTYIILIYLPLIEYTNQMHSVSWILSLLISRIQQYQKKLHECRVTQTESKLFSILWLGTTSTLQGKCVQQQCAKPDIQLFINNTEIFYVILFLSTCLDKQLSLFYSLFNLLCYLKVLSTWTQIYILSSFLLEAQ